MNKIEKSEIQEIQIRAIKGDFKEGLSYLRYEFSNNEKFKDILKKENISVEEILSSVEIPGDLENIEKCIMLFLNEISVFGEQELIIDQSTGLAISPLNDGSIFRPIKFDESGNKTLGRPIIHPAIASALALKKQDITNKDAYIKKVGKNVSEHERNIDSILEIASKELGNLGIEHTRIDEGSEIKTLEIGTESIHGVFQTPNEMFHRFALYGSILSKKIASMNLKNYEFISINERTNSKSRWYEVKLKVRTLKELPSQNP